MEPNATALTDARRERDVWRERCDLANQTIYEAADLLLADIIDDDVAIDVLVLDAIERVIAERDRLREAAASRLSREGGESGDPSA